MVSLSKPYKAILAGLIVTVLAVGQAGLAHAQTGTLLRNVHLPAFANHPIYFPVGVAFDGTNLWYSNPSTGPMDIFQISTTGTLLSTLNKQAYAGALAWDGANLWVAPFDASAKKVELYLVSVGPHPQIVKEVDITSIILGNGSCAAISGLYYNLKKDTLWVTPNACVGPGITNRNTSYLIDTSGNLLRTISFSIPVAALTKVGDNFYVTNKGGYTTTGLQAIVQTNEDGNVITSFGGADERNEQTSYDPSTFAPDCALWTMHFFFNRTTNELDGNLNAYEIPCAD